MDTRRSGAFNPSNPRSAKSLWQEIMQAAMAQIDGYQAQQASNPFQVQAYGQFSGGDAGLTPPVSARRGVGNPARGVAGGQARQNPAPATTFTQQPVDGSVAPVVAAATPVVAATTPRNKYSALDPRLKIHRGAKTRV